MTGTRLGTELKWIAVAAALPALSVTLTITQGLGLSEKERELEIGIFLGFYLLISVARLFSWAVKKIGLW